MQRNESSESYSMPSPYELYLTGSVKGMSSQTQAASRDSAFRPPPTAWGALTWLSPTLERRMLYMEKEVTTYRLGRGTEQPREVAGGIVHCMFDIPTMSECSNHVSACRSS